MSRKIDIETAQAFNNNRNYSNGNTVVMDGCILLHGHKIAERVGRRLFIDACGFKTQTTKARLNALCGVSIRQVSGAWYLNGVEWDGERIEACCYEAI